MCRLICSAAVVLCAAVLVNDASASCVCRCVNGEVQALCSSSIDLPPICPPRVCPITPPSVAPIQAPRVPPIGTTVCRQAQVFNQRTGQYEWREVCR
jgi:hypothetical protein